MSRDDDFAAFAAERRAIIAGIADDAPCRTAARDFRQAAARLRYTYTFDWLGLPVIQFPQDLVALQEIVWRTRPDVIVETGIARGGSVVFHASLMAMTGGGRVIAVDNALRPHNRRAILGHPLAGRISLVDGSSVDPAVVARVRALAGDRARAMVVLDSNHTRGHVGRELELYAPLVAPGCYLVVFDTLVEEMPDGTYPDRPWGPGNSPATAVADFLASTDAFERDAAIDAKLCISAALGGWLRRRA